MDKKKLSEERLVLNQQFPSSFLDEVELETYARFLKPTKEKALFVCMMDASGSMGMWEKYMVRCVWFWIKEILQRKYEAVELRFIAHHTEASVVTEEGLFGRGLSGGTIASSPLRLSVKILAEEDFSDHDIYMMHGTDGDNLTADNPRYTMEFEKLMAVCKRIDVINLNYYDRHDTIKTAFDKKPYGNTHYFVMRDREDIYDALIHYFYPLAESNIPNIGHAKLLDKEY